MRQETIPLIQQLNHNFVGEFVYDMGGGYNPVTPKLIGDKQVKVVDYIAAPSVDIVCDLMTLETIEDDSVDNIFCSDALEHVSRPWKAIEAFYRVLKPNGVMFITAPFIWHFHGHELETGNWSSRVDFWRFTPAALKVLCDDYFETIQCDWDLIPPLGPSTGRIWRCGAYFLGRKRDSIQTSHHEVKPDGDSW